MYKALMSFLLVMVLCITVNAAPYEIKNIRPYRIIDGDTFTVDVPNIGQQSIRIWGIDALEKKQAYGPQCTEFLTSLIQDKPLTLKVHNKDQYGRLVAQVYHEGADVGLKMVRYGYAFHANKLNKDKALKQAQMEAKRQGLGMWGQAKEPTAPWVYRKVPKWQ